MALLYLAAAFCLVSGIGSMGLAVIKAEEGKTRPSRAFYLGSIVLIVLAACVMIAAHAKP
jgi:hypothetical protein